MATRTELLDAFETKLAAEGSFLLPAPGTTAMPDQRSYIHESYESLDGTHVVEWHVSLYWDNVQDNVTKAQFYVKDRGATGEDATWFKGNNPKPDPTDPTFQQEATAWLQSKVADGTIVHFSGVSANEATERATCDVMLEDTGTLVEKRVGLWRDAQGDFQYQVITSS